MSKIHKALEILRQNQQTAPQAESLAEPQAGDDPATAAANAQSAALARSTEPAEPAGLSKSQQIGRVWQIDVAALVESGLYPPEESRAEIAQDFRRIKRPIINGAFGVDAIAAENANLIMIAGPLPKAGKTFCAVNLAASIARERDVGAVLVDADVLKPNISRVVGLESEVGLIDHLLDPSISLGDIVYQTDFHGIAVVPAGQRHPEATELLASRRMGEFVSALSQNFSSRMIIVDTPPLLVTNEAHVLSEHMGQIVMVIEAGVSTQESVIGALESLNRDKPINAILNKSRVGTFGDYGRGAYDYNYTPE